MELKAESLNLHSLEVAKQTELFQHAYMLVLKSLYSSFLLFNVK
jgi:hypothetical protein